MDSEPIIAGPAEPPPKPAGDCWCDVSRAPGRIGMVKSLRFLDTSWDSSDYLGRPLAPLLEALGAGAALGAVEEVVGGRVGQSASALLSRGDNMFRVVNARALDDSTARVTVRFVEAELLPRLLDARAATIAKERGLSDREQQVLTLLIRGRAVEDIATMLGIAPRTVKFHQANVLEKLGADSRLDLLRVLL